MLQYTFLNTRFIIAPKIVRNLRKIQKTIKSSIQNDHKELTTERYWR